MLSDVGLILLIAFLVVLLLVLDYLFFNDRGEEIRERLIEKIKQKLRRFPKLPQKKKHP